MLTVKSIPPLLGVCGSMHVMLIGLGVGCWCLSRAVVLGHRPQFGDSRSAAEPVSDRQGWVVCSRLQFSYSSSFRLMPPVPRFLGSMHVVLVGLGVWHS